MIIDISNFKKIAISGLHGTGKTILAKKIASVTGYTYLPEIAREILEASNSDWRNYSEDRRMIFEKAIVYSQLHMVIDNEYFVADRSILDPLCYCLGERVRNTILKIIKDNLRKFYDVILFFNHNLSYCDLSKLDPVDLKVRDNFEKLLYEDYPISYKHVTEFFYVVGKGDTLLFRNKEIII